jgi:ubiquinone/menaquinone biosynthesis C-methylase UbiE
MKRSYEAEIMDDFSIRDGRIDEALRELKIINKYLGGISTTKSALKYFLDSANEKLSVLDIGSGSSDNLMVAREKYPAIKIISIDKNIRALSSSKNLLEKINSDAFILPFKDNSCDIIHTALFFHHFTYEQLNKLMKEFLRISRKGIIINDLQRSYFALIGIKILTVLFSKSEMVKNDAPISVKRGFQKQELLKLLSDVGAKDFVIKKKWAFRWMVVIKK